MGLKVHFPQVENTAPVMPEECPYGCGCQHFKKHGKERVREHIRDTQHEQAASQGWRCVKCHRTFRTYPAGISNAQQSNRLKAMSSLLYVLGLSYGGVADFLEALGVGIGKTTVYENAQAAGVVSRQRQKQERETGTVHQVIGSDGTYVNIKGVKVGLQVVVGDSSQELLGLELTLSENSPQVVSMIEEIAQKVKAEVLVSDDLGSYQEVADGLDLQRPEDAAQILRQLYHRYQAAPQPPPGNKHDVWYRMRMLVTRLWNRWQRLTLDQRRADLDGTNNASERVIGWWIKERYRTMRGYKRAESVRNIVTLTARMGASSGHFDMAELFA